MRSTNYNNPATGNQQTENRIMNSHKMRITAISKIEPRASEALPKLNEAYLLNRCDNISCNIE